MLNDDCTNHLSGQTSPYLLQHAHNPVDWYPWGAEALDKARREDKPILLSVGYSACHWCHVMAHESFEDAQTASVMNELFVNIKVDREERPDLDKIYQTAHHLLTQRGGGWPLTMVLTPNDHTPFFAGTYFPPAPRHGMPAFADLMRRVETFYRKQRNDIDKQNDALVAALRSTNPVSSAQETALTLAPLHTARRQIEDSFDPQFGGFSRAPKFPHPTNIELLMRQWAHSAMINGYDKADGRALGIARFTLQMMALGGIYDQLGGGFCRYSVDDRWMIPHFEKMLYDNGPLLTLYAQATAATHEPLFRRIAIETANWVMAEMQSPEGGYYSTLDADSEGQEGKFYVWTQEQVRELLTEQEYQIIAQRFGLNRAANFEIHGGISVAGGRMPEATEGGWHLHVFENTETIARALGLPEQQVMEILGAARQKLFEAREARIHPGCDEKILTSWNGLMIKGMAVTGRLLGEDVFIDSAERALDFIKATLWKDGRLLATYKDGKAHLQAYLDDYVFLIDAILEFSQARWRDGDLAFAVELAEVVLTHFQDDAHGGFFFTADDHEKLMYRPKPVIDDATPAGNGIAATVLGRLGYLLGEPRYLEAAERTVKAAWQDIERIPYAHTTLLLALEEMLNPPQNIILRGESLAMQAWQARCHGAYAPRRLAFAIPADAKNLPPALSARSAAADVVAYVCNGHTCSAPITELAELDIVLKQSEASETS
jgi:uncharacterized protein YyaL (SSP411 family)